MAALAAVDCKLALETRAIAPADLPELPAQFPLPVFAGPLQ